MRKPIDDPVAAPIRITRFVSVVVVIWTAVAALSVHWYGHEARHITEERAISRARTNVRKDQAFRNWAAGHGGVYVAADAATPPNPNLAHVADQVLTTTDGRRLILMNPAYVLRQMNEQFAAEYGISGHLTSLKASGPQTEPDAWERAALLALERGTPEVAEFTTRDGAPYLRLMQPMIMKPSCLKCHGDQGYALGDVRGGVAIDLPLEPLLATERASVRRVTAIAGGLWTLGLGGILMGGTLLRRHDGRRLRAVAAMRQTHGVLVENEKRLDLVLSAGELGLWDWNVETGEVIYDDRWAQMLGYELAEVLPDLQSWTDRVHPDDLPAVKDILAEHVAGRTPIYRTEHRVRHKSGDWIWVRDTGLVWKRDPQGKPLRAVGAHEDITPRKHAEDMREIALRQLRALVDNLQAGVLVESPQRRILHVNRSFCEMFALPSPDALVGMDCLAAGKAAAGQFEQPAEFIAGVEAIVASGGDATNDELELADGRVFERDYVPVERNGDLVGNMWIYRDVTARRQRTAEAVRQERLAAVGQMAAGIAHDFNNILCTVMGSTELMQTSPDTPAAMQPRLALIEGASRRAARLVRQILDFSQKTISAPRIVDLSAALQEAVGFLAVSIPENIQVDVSAPPEALDTWIDPTQLQQLLANVIINARDAMPQGGRLSLGLARTTLLPADAPGCPICGKDAAGDWICLTIADTGIGIPPGNLARIFEPFFTTKGGAGGSGLGLAQVAGIISQHGGHVLVSSEIDRGTTLRVLFPELMAESDVDDPVAADVEVGRGDGQTILVVEDDTAVLNTTAAMLDSVGYRVLTAAAGEEALGIFSSHHDEIDLVLTDDVLPGMAGTDLRGCLFDLDHDVKIVVFSGYPLHAAGTRDRENGVVAWLDKPVGMSQLAEVLARTLARQATTERGEDVA